MNSLQPWTFGPTDTGGVLVNVYSRSNYYTMVDTIWPKSAETVVTAHNEMLAEMAELLFTIEAALPFVEAQVEGLMCSSSGGPAALRAILKRYDWDNQRSKFLPACKE